MRKIMFVNASLTGGGSERVMTALANKACEKHDTVMVLVREKERTYPVSDKLKIIQLSNNCSKVKLFLKRIIDLRKTIKMEQPDTVVAFMDDISFFTITACIGLKVRKILSIRNDPNRKDKRHFYWLSRLYNNRLADWTVFQTEDAQNCYPKVIRNKSVVIPNPIASNIPNAYQGERDNRIVAVGRLVPQKRFELLIDAYKKFNCDNSKYILEIYGEGPEYTALQKRIEDLGLSERVFLKGFASDVIERIKTAAMYVSCSDFEGISNTMLEAMALGIPTICTNCPIGGAAMVIKNNENGLLIPVGDVEAIYNGMMKLADASDLAKKVSKNAVKVREDYSVDKIWTEWEKIV